MQNPADGPVLNENWVATGSLMLSLIKCFDAIMFVMSLSYMTHEMPGERSRDQLLIDWKTLVIQMLNWFPVGLNLGKTNCAIHFLGTGHYLEGERGGDPQ